MCFVSENKNLSTQITLTSEEVSRVLDRGGSGSSSNNLNVPPGASFQFEGIKSRTKEQLQRLMYTDEMDQWLAEARREEANQEARRRQATAVPMEEADAPTPGEATDDGNNTIRRTRLPD